MALLLLVPHLALGQPEEDPRKTAKIHVGAVYITPTLALTNLGFDSNVFNQSTGQKAADFTFTVTPGADVWVPFARRAMIITKASVDLVYFQTFSSERSVDPFVSVRPEVYFNRLRLFAEGSYLDTRQRPSFEIDARARRHEEAAEVGFALRVRPKVSVELAGRERHIRFAADQYYEDTNLEQTLNRNERALSARLRYRLTPLMTVVLLSEAENDRFVYSPIRNTDSVRIMPGLELSRRALVSGSGYLGYRRFVGLSDALPDFDGLVARGRLSYTLLGSTRFEFTADRDVQYSFERTQPYYLQTGFGLTVRHSLTRRFDVSGGLQRHGYDYREFFVGAEPRGTNRVDVTRNVNFSVGYRASRDTRLGIGASYWERTSNTLEYRAYNSLRVGLTVGYGF